MLTLIIWLTRLNVQNVVPVALITSKNVVSSLIKKEIDYGVMAIKNSIAGDVAETKEALTEHIELVDTAEIDIHHCLFTKNNQAKIQRASEQKDFSCKTKRNLQSYTMCSNRFRNTKPRQTFKGSKSGSNSQ